MCKAEEKTQRCAIESKVSDLEPSCQTLVFPMVDIENPAHSNYAQITTGKTEVVENKRHQNKVTRLDSGKSLTKGTFIH